MPPALWELWKVEGGKMWICLVPRLAMPTQRRLLTLCGFLVPRLRLSPFCLPRIHSVARRRAAHWSLP
uniref:Uncharacterized protein n=1 Tax=uncultured marine virus TaxID=186617 RepID=A0A0F7L4L2_9VIRU|nr:hypothetical protein [uncultured marine virus]